MRNSGLHVSTKPHHLISPCGWLSPGWQGLMLRGMWFGDASTKAASSYPGLVKSSNDFFSFYIY